MAKTTKAALAESLPSFICPVTFDVMKNPVILAASSITFEKEFIENWLASHDTCPYTNIQLRGIHQLIPNISLRQAIEEWLVKSLHSMIES